MLEVLRLWENNVWNRAVTLSSEGEGMRQDSIKKVHGGAMSWKMKRHLLNEKDGENISDGIGRISANGPRAFLEAWETLKGQWKCQERDSVNQRRQTLEETSPFMSHYSHVLNKNLESNVPPSLLVYFKLQWAVWH